MIDIYGVEIEKLKMIIKILEELDNNQFEEYSDEISEQIVELVKVVFSAKGFYSFLKENGEL